MSVLSKEDIGDLLICLREYGRGQRTLPEYLRAKKKVLSEIDKLNAVREKLVEAIKRVMAIPTECSCEVSNEVTDAWHELSDAIAANAELEGK